MKTDPENRTGSSRSAAANAELALLLEVAGTPKPGNVDRHRDLEELRFEHFLAGAVGARPGLDLAANGAPIGRAFERGVEGMATQRGGNTQFGCLLLLVPLVAASRRGLSQPVVGSIVAETTVADAAAFYRSFEHVDVFVGDPPADLEALDVRRGTDAVPALEARELTLSDVMARSANIDGVAREWATGFERSLSGATQLAAMDQDRPLADRGAQLFCSLLADRPDTLIVKRHGEAVAREVTDRAADLLDAGERPTDSDRVDAFADDLVTRGVNPGTTADITAASLFVALERGVVTV